MTHAHDLQHALALALQPTRQAWLQAAGLATAASGHSLTMAQPVLLVSRLGDGITQQVLAERIGVHAAALVRTLDMAEEAQLLERRAVPGNRRQRAIHLLPAGRALAAELENQLRQLRATLMEGIAHEELETAVRVLKLVEERARAYAESKR